MSLPAAIDLYLSSVAIGVEPCTLSNYRERLTKFSTWVKKRHVTKAVVMEYRAALLTQRMARSSIAMHLSTLRGFYRWLSDHGHVTVNPVPKVRGEEIESINRKEGITHDEYQALLKKAEGYWPYAIQVGWATGFRLGDVALLRSTSVKMSDRTVTIIPKKTRHSMPRVVEIPIGDDLALELTARLEVFGMDQFSYVCPEMANQYLADGHKTLSAQFCTLCRSLGIRKGFHCFRHSFFTRLIGRGINPALVAEMGGVSLNRVMTYVNTPLDVKREAISKIIPLHAA